MLVHNNKADITGTHKLKIVKLETARLRKFYHVSGDLHKTSREWYFSDEDGNVFTIYDWRATNLYGEGLPRPKDFWAQEFVEVIVGGKGNLLSSDFLEWFMANTNAPKLRLVREAG